MKRSSLLSMAALLALAGGAQAAVCRVNATGTDAADGTTWALATTLRDAIDNGNGKDCTEIWVQRGTYAQTSQYVIDRNLVLRGDFAGTEATAAERAAPLDASRTVLDGGGTTRILYINGTTASGPITASTLIEAFTLTGGNGVGADVNMNGLGGAVYCDGYGTGHQCSPRFSGVVFTSNSTARGGAVYNDGYSSGLSSPTFTDVSFSQNTATLGGAVYNDATDAGTSSPTFSNVTFSGNSASFNGGAVYGMATLIGTSDPVFTNVTFSGNSAPGNGSGGTGRGGAVAFEIQHTTIGNPVFTHVTFHGNTAGSMGGAIYNNALPNAASNAVLQSSILWGNTAPNGTQVFNNSATATTALGSSILQGGCADMGITCDAFTTASGAADPLLGALQDNGGSTFTHLPGAGSPALDQARPDFCLATDQRGVPRPQGPGCDIGAVEVRVAAPPATGGVAAVPTLGEWALALMALLAAGLGALALRRRG